MGLAAAYRAQQKGAEVTVLERADRIGGMCVHFDLAGTDIERYYHFVCSPDETTFDYLAELGLQDRLKWVSTKMGYFYQGHLYDWGNPIALLKFPGLSFIQKLRYGVHLLHAKRISNWKAYDAISSTDWLKKWIGERAYQVMWRPLFHYKFYEYENSLSAAWLGTRIKRVALSRKSMFEERLGYLEGGSEMLLSELVRRIRANGGAVELNSPVEQVTVEDGVDGPQVRGLRVAGQERQFDAIISTVPLPYVNELVPALPAEEAAKVAAIRNVGVVCVILKLKKAFTRNFWMNINDSRIEIPGLIEYSNLNPLDGSAIVYAPFYMPQTHPKYARPDADFIEETLAAMALIRPDFTRDDVIDARASRYAFAQTVCSPGFYEALPPMKSALHGLYLADTSHYYPEDRSISESLRVGDMLADLALPGSFEPTQPRAPG